MPITIADITDTWWKKNMDASWQKFGGTGVGEQLRKYESALKALKAGNIPLPPTPLTPAMLANLCKLPNHVAMEKEARQAYKALFEVETKVDELRKKKGPDTKTMQEWSSLIYNHKRDMMALADSLK